MMIVGVGLIRRCMQSDVYPEAESCLGHGAEAVLCIACRHLSRHPLSRASPSLVNTIFSRRPRSFYVIRDTASAIGLWVVVAVS